MSTNSSKEDDLRNPFFGQKTPEAEKFQEKLNRKDDATAESIEQQGNKNRRLFQETVDGRPIITGTDADIDEPRHRHNLDPNRKQVGRDAIFMFPESYNLLRRELWEHWRESLWPAVSWRMAFRAEEFVEEMNDALGLAVVFDTEKVDFISRVYLDKLLEKRSRGDTTLYPGRVLLVDVKHQH